MAKLNSLDRERIKELYFKKKLPVAIIAKRMSISQNTVKRVCNLDNPGRCVSADKDWFWK